MAMSDGVREVLTEAKNYHGISREFGVINNIETLGNIISNTKNQEILQEMIEGQKKIIELLGKLVENTAIKPSTSTKKTATTKK